MKKCVFAGTFDPFTVGHLAVVEKALKIFDNVTVALMVNSAKNAFFTKAERLEMLNAVFADEKRVKVVEYDGAAVDLLEEENTSFYVRGVRDSIDFEYENRDAFASKKLKGDIIFIYLPAEQEQTHISSSLVRNCIKFKKDYKSYVPAQIAGLMEKYTEGKNV